MRGNTGFTLIELTITLVVLGILTTFAVTQYAGYMIEARRADAIKSMTRVLSQQELFYANNGSAYTSIVGDLGYDIVAGNNSRTLSEDQYYEIELSGCGAGIAECVSLTATPAAASPQVRDYYCTSMTVDSRGRMDETHNSSKVTPAPGFSCWK